MKKEAMDYLGTLGFERRNDPMPTVPPPDVDMSREEFCSFSPGMRREMWRSSPQIREMEDSRPTKPMRKSPRRELMDRRTEIQIAARERL